MRLFIKSWIVSWLMKHDFTNVRMHMVLLFEAWGVSDHLRGNFHLTVEAGGKCKPFKFKSMVE